MTSTIIVLAFPAASFSWALPVRPCHVAQRRKTAIAALQPKEPSLAHTPRIGTGRR